MKKEITWIFLVMAMGGLMAPGLFRGPNPAPVEQAGKPPPKKKPSADHPKSRRESEGPEPIAISPAEEALVSKLSELVPGGRDRASSPSLAVFLRETAPRASVSMTAIASFIVTVPDPNITTLDSYFDQALDAVARGVAASGCQPDRFELPWHSRDGGSAEERLAETQLQELKGAAPKPVPDPSRTPGFLLFRCTDQRAPPTPPVVAASTLPRERLLVVFVVGETATTGLHLDAMAEALRLHAALSQSHDSAPVVQVLGPFFSGSSPSLRSALMQLSASASVTVVSGAADGSQNAELLSAAAEGAPRLTYRSALVPAQDIFNSFLSYIRAPAPSSTGGGGPSTNPRRQGKVALLSESGTGWAATFNQGGIDEFRFPLHVGKVRAAHERIAGAANNTSNLHATLDLQLDQDAEEADIVPIQSALTPYEIELNLREQLTAIARAHYQYLGILATDPADTVFIAKEARKYCPGVQLFTFGADLLFAHPSLLRDLNGLLVLSTFPIGAGSPRWMSGGGIHQTFAGSAALGIFNASRAIMAEVYPTGVMCRTCPDGVQGYGSPDSGQPRAWFSVVNNAGLWPVASVSLGRKDGAPEGSMSTSEAAAAAQPTGPAPYVLCAGAEPPPDGSAARAAHDVGPVGAGIAAVIVLFSLLQILVAIVPPMMPRVRAVGRALWRPAATSDQRFERRAPDRSISSPASPVVRATRARYTLGLVLVLGLVNLYIVAVLFGIRTGGPALILWMLRVLSSLTALLSILTAGGIVVVWAREAAKRRRSFQLQSVRHVAVCAVGLGIVLAAGWYGWSLLAADWSPSVDHLLAIARTVQPVSGVSPALPLIYLSLAAFLWCWTGRNGTEAQARIPESTPFPHEEDLSSIGLGDLSWRILSPRPPLDSLLHEGVALFAGILPAVYFVLRLNPTFEGSSFDWAFKVVSLFVVALVLSSSGRTVAAWKDLKRLLRRLAHHPLTDAYDRIDGPATTLSNVGIDGAVPTPADLEQEARLAGLLAAEIPAAVVAPVRQRLELEAKLVLRSLKKELEGPARDARIGTQEALFRMSRVLFTALERLWTSHRLANGTVGMAAAAPVGRGGAMADFRRGLEDWERRWMDAAEAFVARQILVVLQHGLARLRRLMAVAVMSGLLLVFAVISYPFQPARFALVFSWLVTLTGVVPTISIVVAIERDNVLSRIAHTRPGRVELNASFLGHVFAYGLLPGIALVATLFPELSNILSAWTDPIIKAAR